MLSSNAQRSVAQLEARARVLRHRDRLLGPDSDWDPLVTLIEVALGAPLTTSDGVSLVMSPVNAQGGYDPELRIAAAKELSGFLYPKMKAVEMTVSGGEEPIRHQLVDDIVNLAVKAKLRMPEPEVKEVSA